MIFPALTTSFIAGLSYPALVVAGVVAQPFASLACGSLAAAGLLRWEVVFVIFFLTDLVMDCVWYYLGTRHGERATRLITKMSHVTEEDVIGMHRLFHTRPAVILITAKLLGGFGMMPFVLFTAGASKMPFIRYIALNAFGEVFWTGGFLAIGYYFGAYILQVSGVIEKITLATLGIVGLALFFWTARRVYRRLLS